MIMGISLSRKDIELTHENNRNGQGRKKKKKMKRYSLYFTSKSRYKKALSLMYKKPSIYNEIVGGLSGSKQYYISWRMQ